jgi:hypothetical protein
MEAVVGISGKRKLGIIFLLVLFVFAIVDETAEAARRGRGRGRGGLRRGGAGRVQQRRVRRGRGRRGGRGGRGVANVVAPNNNGNQVNDIFLNDFNGNINPFANNGLFNQFNGFGLAQAGNVPVLNNFGAGFNNGFGFNQGFGFGGQLTPLSQNVAIDARGNFIELNQGALVNGQIANPQAAFGQFLIKANDSRSIIAGQDRQMREETLADIRKFNAGEQMSAINPGAQSGAGEVVQDNVVSLRQ